MHQPLILVKRAFPTSQAFPLFVAMLRPAKLPVEVLFFLLVFISRLVFIWPGFGSEDDSWGLIQNAHLMQETGVYSFSRLPGHPVQEYVLYFLPQSLLQPWFCNLLSVVFSTLAGYFFLQILRKLKVVHPFLWTAVFVSIPLVWISGTYTIDYAWGMCFQLGALYGLMQGRWFWASLALALAAGCRIPSGAFGLVLLPLVYDGDWRIWIKRSLRLGIPAVLLAVLFYLPALLRYGSAFFDFYELPYPSLAKTLYKGSLAVWGLSGTLALLAIPWVWRRSTLETSWKICIASTVLIFGAAFLGYPHKAAFLLPMVPMFVILFATSPLTIIQRFLPMLFFLSPLTFGLNFSDPERGAKPGVLALEFSVGKDALFIDPLQGPLQVEQARRTNRQNYVEHALEKCRTLQPGSVVLCGWWTNQIREMALHTTGLPPLHFAEFLSRNDLQALHHADIPVVFLDEIDRANDERYGMVFTSQFAQPLP